MELPETKGEERLWNLEGRIKYLEILQKYINKKDLLIIFLASLGSFLSIYLVNAYFAEMAPLIKFFFSALLVVVLVLIVFLFINKERLS